MKEIYSWKDGFDSKKNGKCRKIGEGDSKSRAKSFDVGTSSIKCGMDLVSDITGTVSHFDDLVRKYILSKHSNVIKIDKDYSREWVMFPFEWSDDYINKIIKDAIKYCLNNQDRKRIKLREDLWNRENQSKELFDEVLTKLMASNQSLFRRDDTSFLCLFPGFYGEGIKAVYDKLKQFGHSDENIVKRIKVVLSEDIEYYDFNYEVGKYENLKNVDFILTDDGWDVNMKLIEEGFMVDFDVIFSNPPYQRPKQQGSQRGSSTNALWFDIMKKCLRMVKKDGYLAFITPTNLFQGGESYANLFIGRKAKYDVEEICFFDSGIFPKKVGIDVCYWILRNSNKGIKTKIGQGDVNLKNINTLFKNATITNIIDKVFKYNGIKLDCSQTMRFEKNGNGIKYAEKNGIDLKLVEPSHKKTKTHKYPYFWKGSVYWIGLKWKSYGVPKVIIPRFRDIEPFYSSEYVLDGDSMIRVVKNEYEGELLMNVLNTYLFKFLFNMMRTSGRIQPRVKDFKIPSLTKEWTDEELCKEYKFTEEEMECIYGGKCK